MRTKPESANSLLNPLVLVAITVILAFGLLVALPVGNARAAGHWVTGVLTNNTVDDTSPLLSSTHLVWAQKRGDSWDIKLRTIATGFTETIVTVPGSSGLSDLGPQLSIAGDYITIHPRDRNFWHLYRVSTETTSTYVSVGFTLTGVWCEDGQHVVQTVDDGDIEIRAFDITRESSVPITNNAHTDYLGGASHGRIVWETLIPPSGRCVVAYDLNTGEPALVYNGSSDAATGMYPQISENWVAYNDLVAGKLCLHRLADGLTVQADPSSNFVWTLTDDFAFWTEYRSGSSGPVDLYAFDLNTLQKTRLTSDTAREHIVEANGDRVVYMTYAVPESPQGDLMVIDLGDEPLERHILGTGIKLGGPLHLLGVGGRASMCGDVIVALVDDGHDDEICWAMWVEDADGGDDGDGDGGDDGEDGGGDGSVAFSDVSGSPYETAIYDLASRGIILGFDDGTFRPLEKVSRQQFAKMIVKSLGLTVTGTETCPFTDVAKQIGTDPFYPCRYVAVCATSGITTGKTSTTFAPYDDITHQQLTTMVARAAALGTPPAGYDPGFSASQFSLAEHYENARKAAYAGLLDGLQGVGSSYDFLAASTRGECAQILYNLLHME